MGGPTGKPDAVSEGVRIRTRLDIPGDAMMVVVDHARPIPPPPDGTPLERAIEVCKLCGVKHFAKTYHIQLTDGHAIVSTGVWAALQRLRTPSGDVDNPFVAANPVATPPTQRLILPPATVGVEAGNF